MDLNQNDAIRKYVLSEVVPLKERLNEAEKKLSDFSDMLKAMTDVDVTDLEIAQAESEQAITDIEIELAELDNNNN